MTRRIVVFRFDRNPLVCRDRIRGLRRLNPGLRVFGLYGGKGGYRGWAFRTGSRRVLGLEGFYASGRDGRWNWKNGDLALAAWYRAVGHRLDFDVVHFVEWDLLLIDSLERVYAEVPPGAVGLTLCTPLSRVGDWDWLRGEENLRELDNLTTYARERFAYVDELQACLGPGPCFPRSFLADYAELDVPEMGHDELRMPLFAKVLGYPVVDTGFRRAWESADEDAVFNARGIAIAPSTVRSEARKPDGRRAFHPVRVSVDRS